MDPLHIRVEDIRYRRPGLTKIYFVAKYPGYIRRGTVVYDTIEKIFITHIKDVRLLAAVCSALQRPSKHQVG